MTVHSQVPPSDTAFHFRQTKIPTVFVFRINGLILSQKKYVDLGLKRKHISSLKRKRTCWYQNKDCLQLNCIDTVYIKTNLPILLNDTILITEKDKELRLITIKEDDILSISLLSEDLRGRYGRKAKRGIIKIVSINP
jgi:hypothetical protein